MTYPFNSAYISIFFTGIQQLLLYQEIQIQIAFLDIISNSFNFLESLKVVLINMVAILVHDVIISVHDVTEILL